MEYLTGETLKETINREAPMAIARAVKLAYDAAVALDAAHSRGVVHRDLKPANLFLCRFDWGEVLKVLDFGIAKMVREAEEEATRLTETGVFLGMRVAAPYLKRSEHASVINISSIFGASGGFGVSPAYHAAKGAVRTLTKNVALHWATEGVRVNSIHPGFIATPILEQSRDTPIWEGMTALTPMGRLGTSEEVADVILYLCSDRARFIQGQTLEVNGGFYFT